MSILINAQTKVICQGITGDAGSFHSRQMLEYGTHLVGGVTPGKGGSLFEGKVPIFDTAKDAVKKTGAQASVLFVPAAFSADAVREAADAGIELIVCITEGIPVLDMVKVKRFLEGYRVRLIGPNCPGIITPGGCKIGIMPGYIHQPGNIGVVSRSGTLTYEAVWQLTSRGIGQSTCIGIGGDPVLGSGFLDVLELFEKDDGTEAVVMIGEIGGEEEERAADFIKNKMSKPVVAFVAGMTAPEGKRMGHAGAIISAGSGKASDKIKKLEESGVMVSKSPADIGETLQEAIKSRVTGRK